MRVIGSTKMKLISGGNKAIAQAKKRIKVCFDAYSRCTPTYGEALCRSSPPYGVWACSNQYCIISLGKSGGECNWVKNTCPEFFHGPNMSQCQCYRDKNPEEL